MPKSTLRMFDALPAYLGGKRSILSQIFREVARHIDPSRWKSCTFIDGFSGGGSVSMYAKAQFRHVDGNDLSDRAALIARALLCNNATRLSYEDATLLLAGAEPTTTYTQTQKDWFIPATALFIDRGLAYADTVASATKADLLRLLVWRVMMDSRPSAGTFTSRRLAERFESGELKPSGHGGAKFAFRPPDIRDLRRLVDLVNQGVFRGSYAFTQLDALEASERWNADIVYLDPPYAGDEGYEVRYRVADNVMARCELPREGQSPFSDKRVAEGAVATLIGNVAKAGAKFVLLNNGDGAITRERLLGLVAAHYDAFEVPIIHNHTSASAHGNDGKESGATEAFIVGTRT